MFLARAGPLPRPLTEGGGGGGGGGEGERGASAGGAMETSRGGRRLRDREGRRWEGGSHTHQHAVSSHLPGETTEKMDRKRKGEPRKDKKRTGSKTQSEFVARPSPAGGRVGAWRCKFQRPSIPELWLGPLGDLRLPKRDITTSVHCDGLQAHASRQLKQVKSIIIKSCRAVGAPQSGALDHVAAVSLRLFPLLLLYPHTRPRPMYIRGRPIMCSFQANVFRPIDSIP